jgi:hypothetical protein
MTQRDLVIRISRETGMVQEDVLQIVQRTLEHISPVFANGRRRTRGSLKGQGIKPHKEVRKARLKMTALEETHPTEQELEQLSQAIKNLNEGLGRVSKEALAASRALKEAQATGYGH